MTQTKGFKFELTFWGSAMVAGFPRYRRLHQSAESVRDAIARMQDKMTESGHLSSAAHPPVIYDPAGKQVSLP